MTVTHNSTHALAAEARRKRVSEAIARGIAQAAEKEASLEAERKRARVAPIHAMAKRITK